MNDRPTHKFHLTVLDAPPEAPICIEVPAETDLGEAITRDAAREALGRDITRLLEWWRRGG